MSRHLLRFWPLLFLLGSARAELRIPVNTAYTDPDFDQMVVRPNGKRGWKGNKAGIQWYGEILTPGELTARVVLKHLPAKELRFRLTAGEVSAEKAVTGDGDSTATVDFGAFKVPQAGYVRFRLESLNDGDQFNGSVVELLLDGPAMKDAHFNLKERRNAASVHLFYPQGDGKKVSALYTEATAAEDPVYTFYMAAGWHRGYFGMQVNNPGERRIIFSVWDSGNEGVDRKKVNADDLVTLVAKGEGVYSGDFGNEGTGGHSHLKYMWKTGETQRFLTTARPVDATHTVYAGYYFHPDQGKWMLISAWKAPKDGGWLKGLHSFSENFGGSNGHLRRKAFYGNQWFRTDDDQWHEITRAGFSHDGTGKADRLDRFMGVEDGKFFLSHGGFVPGFTKYGEIFERPATGKAPADLNLPALPEVK